MGLLAERMEICLSICSVMDRLLSAAKSPLPPALQKMQPLVSQVFRPGWDRTSHRLVLLYNFFSEPFPEHIVQRVVSFSPPFHHTAGVFREVSIRSLPQNLLLRFRPFRE